jgi:ribose transport system ATP-binding protein
MDKDYILEMAGITKNFPGVKALDNVDFKVKRGETHCLLGANGAGKSTLIKVLSGAYQKDEGTIIFDGKDMHSYNTIDSRNAGVAIIYQELSLIDCLSIAENIFLNQYEGNVINWKVMKKKAEEICKKFRLNLDVTKPVSTLSMGRKQLVEIMKALSIGAKMIVMDEPSATLSEEEFSILLDVIEDLKKQGITIVYISHRLDEIFQVGDRITVMMNGRNVATRDVKALSMDQLVELMIGHKVDTERIVNNSVRYDEEPVLIMENSQSKKVGPINFCVHKGEIFGIYGLVGSGRTEVLRMIFGIDQIISGQIIYKSNKFKPKSPNDAICHSIGLVPENRKKEGIVQILPVWENADLPSLNKLSHHGILKISELKSIVKGYIKDLSIKTPSENTICRNLSGGNQQKVVLAKWLIKGSEFLLVDEPTQGIDIGAKDQIYKIIMDTVATGKSVLIVSSELDELVKICNKIAVMYEGHQINIFDMNTTNKNDVLEAAITGRVG